MPFFSRFPSFNYLLEGVAGFHRNQWPLCSGISGRIQPEYAIIQIGLLFFRKISNIRYLFNLHSHLRQGL